MQTELCLACKMYIEGCDYLAPNGAQLPIQDAELVVIVDTPSKHDIRFREYLSKEGGKFLYSVLAPYVDPSKVYVTSAVRCRPPKGNCKSPEANKCYKQFLREKVDYLRTLNRDVNVLLLGFWPPKLVLGRDLKEIGGKVTVDGNLRCGTLYSPNFFINQHVLWTKDANGQWQHPPGAFERAETGWREHSIPVLSHMFSAHKGNIVMGLDYVFPKVIVREPDELINRLTEYTGQLVTYDIETLPTDLAKANDWTALDWFFGSDVFRVTSTTFGLFQNMDETGYTPGSRALNYDKEKMVTWQGEWTPGVAEALQRMKPVAFHASYDSGAMQVKSNVRIPVYADPCDMAYVVDQGRKNYKLESLIYQYVPEFASYAGDIKKKKDFNLPPPILMNYNAGDVYTTSVLFFKLMALIEELGLQFVYWEVMAGGKPYLLDMEVRGVEVNWDAWEEISPVLRKQLGDARNSLMNDAHVRALFARRAKGFNPNSGPNIIDVLCFKYGEGSFASSAKKVLTGALDAMDRKGLPPCPFIKGVLDYRRASKVVTTYVDGLKDRTRNNIAYPSFRMNTTETGRTSSGGGDAVGMGKTRQINIQNIPRNGGLRALFKARPGHYLAYADYGQIEVRVAGACASSEEIYEACVSGRDFHGTIASRAYGMAYEDIMAEDAAVKAAGTGTSTRTNAKTVTFGVLYGMSAIGLAVQLNLKNEDGTYDTDTAQSFIDGYFSGMQSVKNFIVATHEEVARDLYVRTAMGRIRRFERFDGSARRESVNTKIQSVASDIFLLALRTTGEQLIRQNLYNRYVWGFAEVHDAITWEVHNSVPQDEIKGIMQECMVHTVRRQFPLVDEFLGRIPLEVDFKFDTIWH